MVSSSRRRESHDGSKRQNSPVKDPPQFFKIIHSSVDPLQKLMIPRKFIGEYGKNLGNSAFLQVPRGAVWQVELKKSNGDVWFCNGWEKFTEYYSICYGYFLVFRYDGNSHFHVRIFGMSASEIEYPFDATHGGGQTKRNNCNGNSHLLPETKQVETDDSIEILEHFPVSSTYNVERDEIPRWDEIENDVSVDHLLKLEFQSFEMKRNNSTSKKENHSNMPPFSPKFESRGLRQLATANVNSRALKKAQIFKSKKPFFVVQMHPSHVSSKCNLSIPMDFGKKYLGGKHKKVILGVSDGRTWSVNCYYETSSCRCVLGWKSFARDNNLKVGDVCIFELMIKGVKPRLNVIIIENDVSVEILEKDASVKKLDDLLEPADFRSTETKRNNSTSKKENRSNMPAFSPNFQSRRLKLLNLNKDVKTDIEEECSEGMSIGPHHQQSQIPVKKQSAIANVNSRALEKAQNFKSKKPFFMVHMHRHHVSSKYCLNIPLAFAKKYLNGKYKTVVLRVSDGRTWSVNCYAAKISCRRMLGWKSFARDNNLKVGDVCIFELMIKGVEPRLNVIIFRK